MQQQVITAALTAQRQQLRQERAYDGYVNHCTKFGGRNRAARRRTEKAPVEVLVGGSLLFQALLGGVDMTAMKAWQAAEARTQSAKAAARKKAGVQ